MAILMNKLHKALLWNYLFVNCELCLVQSKGSLIQILWNIRIYFFAAKAVENVNEDSEIFIKLVKVLALWSALKNQRFN